MPLHQNERSTILKCISWENSPGHSQTNSANVIPGIETNSEVWLLQTETAISYIIHVNFSLYIGCNFLEKILHCVSDKSQPAKFSGAFCCWRFLAFLTAPCFKVNRPGRLLFHSLDYSFVRRISLEIECQHKSCFFHLSKTDFFVLSLIRDMNN
jgi:hypothetical protein